MMFLASNILKKPIMDLHGVYEVVHDLMEI